MDKKEDPTISCPQETQYMIKGNHILKIMGMAS
jgi:hypothetical protein